MLSLIYETQNLSKYIAYLVLLLRECMQRVDILIYLIICSFSELCARL